MEYLGDNDDADQGGDADGQVGEVVERQDGVASSSGAAADSTVTAPKKSEDRCNAIRFSDICKLFEKVSKIQGSAAKLKLLFNKELKQHLQGQSVFPLLRLILPANDTERGKYGLKQASIAKMYVKALSLNQDAEDAKRLLNWKDQSKTGVELSKLVSGEFGTILESVLKERIRAEESTANLFEVNKLLDDLANAITVEDKTNIMRHRVLDHFNAVEQKWLVRIIFQDLKIGLKHEVVLRYFYPTALRRYNECTNLRTVCEEEGLTSDLVGVQLFVNFSPMLAKGFPNSTIGQVNAVINAMDKNPFVMDLKLDGERILCHIEEDASFTLFTRRGNDYTEYYWPVVHNILTGMRKKTPGKNFSCILDGEIIAIDGATKDFIPFGNNLTVAKKEREYGDDKQTRTDWHTDLPSWMAFYAFDIVYLEGAGSEDVLRSAYQSFNIEPPSALRTGEITNIPLVIRRKILTSILEVEPYRVEIVPHRYVLTNDVQERKNQLEAYFNEVTLAGKEGLVVKNLNSKYELGEKSRGFGHWVKMKPEYGDHAEDLDLLILAGYYGEGHSVRGEGISTFLLGVKDDRDPSLYHTVCKVGTGYSFQELQTLREKLKDIAHPWDESVAASSSSSSRASASILSQPGGSSTGPEYLSHWKITKRDDRPHVYFLPEESIVMQLKCAEIVESNAFSCGYTCRFPRVQQIRYDKGYRDILSLSDIIAAKNKPRNTIAPSTQDEQAHHHSNKRKKKDNGDGSQSTDHHRRMNPIDDQFRIQNVAKKVINVDGHIFTGCTFCVIGTDFQYQQYQDRLQGTKAGEVRKFSRDQIMTEIKKQEGEVVANASFPNCVVIAGSTRTLQLKNLIEQGEKDVLDFSYVIDCLDAGYKLPLRGFYYLSISAATRKSMEGLIDPFGDSFVDDVLPPELSKILQNVDDSIARLERKQLLSASSSSTTSKRKAAALEQMGELTKSEKQLIQDWNRKIKGKCWRSLLSAHFVEEEREAFYHEINSVYQEGIIIYLDIFAGLGSCDTEEDARFNSKKLFANPLLIDTDNIASTDLEVAKCLFYRMKARGAIFADHLHGAVTHVVLCRQALNVGDRWQAIQDRIRVLRKLDSHNFEKRIVGYEWMDACLEQHRIVEPSPDHLIRPVATVTTSSSASTASL